MWFKFLNSKWFERIFTASIAIICVLIGQAIITQRDGTTSLRSEFAKRPTFEYVDAKDEAMIKYIDKQDNNTKDLFQKHFDESSKSDENVMKYIQSMDHKIDIILSRPR